MQEGIESQTDALNRVHAQQLLREMLRILRFEDRRDCAGSRSDPDQAAGRLREQLDIDSMDFLNFVIGLNMELGVEVPSPMT